MEWVQYSFQSAMQASCIAWGVTSNVHLLQVTGWGEKHGEPYWIIRNSWGTYWGELGFFK